jgi:hypothetical protein
MKKRLEELFDSSSGYLCLLMVIVISMLIGADMARGRWASAAVLLLWLCGYSAMVVTYMRRKGP